MSINRIIKKKEKKCTSQCVYGTNKFDHKWNIFLVWLHTKYEKLIPSNYRLFIKNTKPNLLLFQNGMSEGESE